MRRQTTVILCLIIAVMLIIISAMTVWLYSPAKTEKSSQFQAIENVEASMDSLASTLSHAEADSSVTVDSTAAMKTGFPVVNCASGRENLLRQNADLSLELIDHNGKSLWTIPFPGKLCGALVQVDFYSNKKIQFLVAEGCRVHLLDRIGREVESFPRTMPSAITYGPEEIMHHGVKYYKVTTVDGAVYFTMKDTKIITQLPE